MRRILLTLTALLLGLVSVSAQTSLTSTTTSAAVTRLATTFQVASATGITAGTTGLFAPATGEFMQVTGLSGTTVTVVRAAQGAYPAAPIASGATIIVVPPNGSFAGVNPRGSCTGVNTPQFFQLINLLTADVNVCLAAGTWEARNGLPLNYDTTVVLTR